MSIRGFPGRFESSSVSRDNVSREIGRIPRPMYTSLYSPGGLDVHWPRNTNLPCPPGEYKLAYVGLGIPLSVADTGLTQYSVADKWGRHSWGRCRSDEFWQIWEKGTPWHFWGDKSRLTGVPKESDCQST